jgi:hypothetical protein
MRGFIGIIRQKSIKALTFDKFNDYFPLKTSFMTISRNILIIVIVALSVKIFYFVFAVGVFQITNEKSFQPDYDGLISTLKKMMRFGTKKLP